MKASELRRRVAVYDDILLVLRDEMERLERDIIELTNYRNGVNDYAQSLQRVEARTNGAKRRAGTRKGK